MTLLGTIPRIALVLSKHHYDVCWLHRTQHIAIISTMLHLTHNPLKTKTKEVYPIILRPYYILKV